MAETAPPPLPTAPSAAEPGRRRRLLILTICCLSLFVDGLDVTVVNIALPAIRADLHASASGLQWVIDAYTLVLASLLMLSGSTADRFGRRRTFQAGLALFALGSLLCGLAPGLGWLIAFRALQAIGGSMLNPVAMSIITNTFTDPRERAQAIGVWGGVIGISMSLGPVLGGVLVDAAGWRSIFWINVPVGLAALALTAAFVPESRARRPRRLDPAGQVLVIGFLGTLTYAIIEGPNRGWASPVIIAAAVLAAACLTAFLAWERRCPEPLIDLRFFRSIPFTGATLTAICAFAAFGGFLFLNTLYLQEVRGYDAVRAGLWTLPIAVFVMVCPPISGAVIARRGPRLPLLLAGTALTASSILLTRLTAHSPATLLLVSYALFGFGFGMVNAPITNAAVSGMPRDRAGVAAAVASTSRQAGNSLGVAVIGTVVTSAVTGPLATGLAPASHAGWWITAGCGAAVLLLGIITSTRWAGRTAAEVAARLDPDHQKAPVRR